MKKVIRKITAVILVTTAIITSIASCRSGSSSSSDWEKDANSAGYYKKGGTWYYQGKGAY